MTVRRLGRASVLVALLAPLAGCGAQPATAPPQGASVAISARMVVAGCDRLQPRQVPLRMALLLEGSGRRIPVTTRAAGNATVRLAPGRYTVAPARPALRHAIVSLRFDRRVIAASPGGRVVDVAGGRHQMLLLVGLRPLECNGLGQAG